MSRTPPLRPVARGIRSVVRLASPSPDPLSAAPDRRLRSDPPSGRRSHRTSGSRSFVSVAAEHGDLRSRLEPTLCRLRSEVSAVVGAAVPGAACHVRFKGALSTWLKARSRSAGPAALDDLVGVRVLVDRTPDCYRALEAATRRWRLARPVVDRIARPKENGYRSIHAVLEDEISGRFELQIRTRSMHRACESGRAAHSRYKSDQLLTTEGTRAAEAPTWLTGPPSRPRVRDRISRAVAGRRDRVRSWSELVGILAMIGLVGWLDFLSGWQIGFAIFYLLPVSVASWRWGTRTSLAVSALCTLVWWLADRGTSPLPLHPLVTSWNAFMRFGIFALLGVTLARLREVLVHNELLARTDHLTGLPNSRAFFEAAEREIDAARRSGTELTVGFLDLDDFGALNDQLGHTGADRLLGEWAGRMKSKLRPTDTVARIGGDEFALLLPHTRNEDARTILERLWADLAADAATLERPVGLSLGAVTFARPPRSIDAILHEADVSMFKAKAGGKGTWNHESRSPEPGPEPGMRTSGPEQENER